VLLNGWDTVFVADADALNASLERSTSQLQQPFSFSEQGFSTSGTFGTWSIVPGGSGPLLMLQIDIASGTMRMSADGPSIDLSGMGVQLLVNLQLLPSPDAPSSQSLVFDFEQVGTAGGPGVVTPHDVVNSWSLSTLEKAALGNAVANTLVQHADEVSFVFATINPTQSSAISWIDPVASKYAYVAPAGLPPALTILSVVTQRDISGLPLLVDPSILQGVGNAGLAIEPGLFLEKVMGPALLQNLGTSGTLVLNLSGVLVNTGRLSLPRIDRASESYYPTIKSLTASITDNQVNVAMDGGCDMHMGVSMTFSAKSSLGVALASDGMSLQFSTVGQPTFHKDVDIPWYDHLFDVVGGLAEAILQICVAAISSELAGGISDVTSSQALVQTAPAIIDWADVGGFTAQSASLATALCLRGQAGATRQASPLTSRLSPQPIGAPR
jgi:hypothetical protein